MQVQNQGQSTFQNGMIASDPTLKSAKTGRPLNSQQSSKDIKRLPLYMLINLYFQKFYDNIKMPYRLYFPNHIRHRLHYKFPQLKFLNKKEESKKEHMEKLIIQGLKNIKFLKKLQENVKVKTSNAEIETYNEAEQLFIQCLKQIVETHSLDVVPQLLQFFALIIDTVAQNAGNIREMKRILREIGNQIADVKKTTYMFLGFKFFIKPQLKHNSKNKKVYYRQPEDRYVLDPQLRKKDGEFVKFTVNLGLFVLSMIKETKSYQYVGKLK